MEGCFITTIIRIIIITLVCKKPSLGWVAFILHLVWVGVPRWRPLQLAAPQLSLKKTGDGTVYFARSVTFCYLITFLAYGKMLNKLITF